MLSSVIVLICARLMFMLMTSDWIVIASTQHKTLLVMDH